MLLPAAQLPPRPEPFSPWALVRHIARLLLPWVFYRHLRSAILWVRAQDCSIEGRNDEALRLARAMAAEFKARDNWRVFEMRQLAWLEQYEDAIEAANAFVLPLLLRPERTAEQEYFLCYAQWIGRYAFSRLATGSPAPSNFACRLDAVVLSTIPDSVKRNFPLVIHPDWENDEKRRRAASHGQRAER